MSGVAPNQQCDTLKTIPNYVSNATSTFILTSSYSRNKECSWSEAKVRVRMAQAILLILRQPLQSPRPLSQGPLPVLPAQVHRRDSKETATKNRSAKVDPVALDIFWGIWQQICPGRNQTTEICDTHNICRSDGADSVAGAIVDSPSDQKR